MLLPAGCSDDDHEDDPADDSMTVRCTLEAKVSVVVSLADATGAPLGDAVVAYSVDTGPQQSCRRFSDGVYSCGREKAGAFTITATRGNESVSGNGVVTRDECHVIPQELSLTLD